MALAIASSGVSATAESTGATERVSVDSAGGQADNASDLPAITADGRFVAFQSGASNLIANDTNGTFDVFVRDRQMGSTERVTISTSGAQGDLGGGAPSISADGRFVAFGSRSANLVSGDTNGVADVFVRDRLNGLTVRVSVDGGGAQTNGFSGQPSISADGRLVAFESAASNLVANDNNGVVDVFVRDLISGTTERMSVSSSGTEGDRLSDETAISGDGRFVAFQSEATNLSAGDINDSQDIYLRDRQAGTTEIVSRSPTNGQALGAVLTPAISSDGRYVAFTSGSANFVSGDTNNSDDVFVLDRTTNTFERVSVSSAGGQADAPGASLPGISGDGHFVTFHSAATNLVGGDTNAAVDVFVRDRLNATTERVSVDSTGMQGNANSLQNSQRGPAASTDGRFVVFSSTASNLVPNDTNNRDDVFVRDRGETAPPPSPPPGPSDNDPRS